MKTITIAFAAGMASLIGGCTDTAKTTAATETATTATAPVETPSVDAMAIATPTASESATDAAMTRGMDEASEGDRGNDGGRVPNQ